MLSKFLLLLLLASFIETVYSYSDPYNVIPCPYPKIENGRIRVKQRQRLVKFMCLHRYELVGNRYVTCRGGKWDVPLPVCVKPGCPIIPLEPNGIHLNEHHNAYVTTICLPGFKIVGSPVIYCDGFKWNGTYPTCAHTGQTSSLSCDFEDPDICGWMQDELHDFDWKRWNKKTPSAFLFTGPSHDHTYGDKQMGYFMYIESTSRYENNTARLLSPIYNSSLAANGCFSFYYHMFGNDMGGLRVYQKPDSIQLNTMLSFNSSRIKQYLLFEKWGNLGDTWFNAVPMLRDLGDNFQIVIEGIRGRSFTSDIAIDDVAILQGNNCTQAILAANTPPPAAEWDSCVGRCSYSILLNQTGSLQCDCTIDCELFSTCCNDYYDTCLQDIGTTAETSSHVSDLPQTQKLVGETTTVKPTTTTLKTTVVTTPKATKIISTEITTTEKISTTTPKVITTTKASTSTKIATTSKVSTTTKVSITPKVGTTPKRGTTIKVGTTPKVSTTPKVGTTTKAATTRKISSTTQKPLSITTTHRTPSTKKVVQTTPNIGKTKSVTEDVQKKKEKAEDDLQKMNHVQSPKNESSSWRAALITLGVVFSVVGLLFGMVRLRGAGGRAALARLRGRATNDAEVRYLNRSDDEL